MLNKELLLDGKVTLWCADVLDALRAMPADHFDCVVTSPPYWGLRDYGVAGQIGLEPTLGDHLAVMVEVFREVRRVLKPTGTVWINYGDCYATAPNGRSAADTKAAGNDDRTFRDKPFSTVGAVYAADHEKHPRRGSGDNKGNTASDHAGRIVADGGYLKPKDLCMIPNRLAIALQDDGWWVRAEIVWGKRNPMPESINDRPSCAHEKIWLLTKASRYAYDAVAVKQPMKNSSRYRLTQPNVLNQLGGDKDAKDGHRSHKLALNNQAAKMALRDKQSGHSRRLAGFNGRWDEMEERGLLSDTRHLRNFEAAPLDVWDIAAEPFPDAHFATFPSELAERCIKVGSCERGCCAACGTPWRRIVAATFVPQEDVSIERGIKGADGQKPLADGNGWEGFPRGHTSHDTTGWEAACSCDAAVVPARVLDPFGGSGTTAIVAAALGRVAALIELNPDYCRMAKARIEAAFMSIDGGKRHRARARSSAKDAGPLFGGSS